MLIYYFATVFRWLNKPCIKTFLKICFKTKPIANQFDGACMLSLVR